MEDNPEANSYTRIYLAREKKQIIDRLMAVVLEYVDTKLQLLEEPCDGEGGCYGHCGGPLDNSGGGSAESRTRQKRPLRNGDEGESPNDEDDENSGNRDKKRTKTDSDDTRLKFVCPYLKRYPALFQGVRTCMGPGFDSVARLKYGLPCV